MVRNSRIFLILCVLWWLVACIIMLCYPAENISRVINGGHSQNMDTFMKIATVGGEAVFIIPFLYICLVFFTKKYFNLPLIIIIIAAAALPSVASNILKQIFDEPRPLKVFEGQDWLYVIPGYKNNYHFSFPSGHTTGAFACFTVASYLSNKKSIVFPIIFIMLAILVGVSRVYLLQHFWEDIFWGSVLGVLMSAGILYFYHTYFVLKKKTE